MSITYKVRELKDLGTMFRDFSKRDGDRVSKVKTNAEKRVLSASSAAWLGAAHIVENTVIDPDTPAIAEQGQANG